MAWKLLIDESVHCHIQNYTAIKIFIVSYVLYISVMEPLFVVTKIIGLLGKNDSLLFHSKLF